MPTGSRALLLALGVRIRKVTELDEGAIYIEDRRLMLLDRTLTEEQVARAIDRVLPSLWATRAS